jgi:NDP-sugar pyrophosphorylase family protein/aminoglycoside/choline kinase family phosphotransferase
LQVDLQQTVNSVALQHGWPEGELLQIAGDGSDRKFYRFSSGPSGSTSIVMKGAGDLAAAQRGNAQWLQVREHLAGCGIRVPEVLAELREVAAVVMEDFGDTTLAERVQELVVKEDFAGVEELYGQAAAIIATMLAAAIDDAHWLGECAFDQAKFNYELEFFLLHYVKNLAGVVLADAELAALRREIVALTHYLVQLPMRGVHRDFHSRNLMVCADGKLGVIDFQDMRRGPVAYDVVSLYFDAYVPLTLPQRYKLLEDGLATICRNTGMGRDLFSRDSWQAMLLQRQLKAIGSFAYLAVVKGKKNFLAYIAPAGEIVASVKNGRWPALSSSASPLTYSGIILAAGKGERLFPLTASLPKPLLPFAGVEVISYATLLLLRAGIRDLTINVHHLGEQLIAYADRNPFGVRFKISDERSELLGTGGAVRAISASYANQEYKGIVVMNGDIITDFPVDKLLAYHQQENALATMALLPRPNPPEQNVWCLKGRVVAIGGETAPCSGATPHGFACIHVLSPEFLRLLPDKNVFGIMEVYRRALAEGALIAGLAQQVFWYDIGTPEAYVRAHHALLEYWDRTPFSASFDPLGVIALQEYSSKKMKFLSSKEGGPRLVAEDQAHRSDISLGSFVVINEECTIATGARIENTVLLSRSTVAAGETVTRTIVSPHCLIKC